MNIFGSGQPDMSGTEAPEFPQGLTWFNSPPLTMKQLRGKVVLIDFWTYSCINCQRTLPHLREWWSKYKSYGFILIGVHDPEFEFEKDPQNLKEAIKNYRVTWPVVADNNYQTWNLYGVHAWPTEFLVNQDGTIIYTHVGEGNYLQTESQIQEALKKAGFELPKEAASKLAEEQFNFMQTPELYLGYLRGILGNEEGYQREHNYLYHGEKYGGSLEQNLVYINGVWLAMPEYLEHARKTKDLEDFVLLNFRAKKVYLVMESATGEPIKVYISLDEAGLKKDFAGSDIQFDKKGEAFVNVQFSTLYNLINTPTFGDHILKISTREEGLRVFAFTFGS